MIDIPIDQIGLTALALFVALAAMRVTYLVIYRTLNGGKIRNGKRLQALKEEVEDIHEEYEDISSRVDEIENDWNHRDNTIKRFPLESDRDQGAS